MPRPLPAELRLRRKLAANVRKLRHAGPKLSVQDAAERAEMHWRHWQKVEAGEISPTLRGLARLASALGVEPYELLR